MTLLALAVCGCTKQAPRPPSETAVSAVPIAEPREPEPAASEAPPPAKPTPEEEASNASAADLDGVEFLLVSAKGYTPVPDVPIRLAFREGAWMVSGGCNNCFGSYTLCESKLCVADAACTLLGCNPELEKQEDWLVAFLDSSPKLTLSGHKLKLSGAEATLEFLDREVADPDRGLVGSTWTLHRFLDSLGQWGFALQVEPTVEFSNDGSFRVTTGCGTGKGRYSVADQMLRLSQVAYQNQGCPTNEDARAQQFIEEVLRDGDIRFVIDAARMALVRGDFELRGTTK